jgi:hypothetical protein
MLVFTSAAVACVVDRHYPLGLSGKKSNLYSRRNREASADKPPRLFTT